MLVLSASFSLVQPHNAHCINSQDPRNHAHLSDKECHSKAHAVIWGVKSDELWCGSYRLYNSYCMNLHERMNEGVADV